MASVEKVYIIYKRKKKNGAWHLQAHTFSKTSAINMCKRIKNAEEVGYLEDIYTGYIPQMPYTGTITEIIK